MPPARSSSYWSNTRSPRYSAVFALPLLLLYEGLAWGMGQSDYAGVRNGADVLLKSLFSVIPSQHGLTVFAALLLGTGAILVVRDIRRNGMPRARVFVGMAAESVVYALALGVVAGARRRSTDGGAADSSRVQP